MSAFDLVNMDGLSPVRCEATSFDGIQCVSMAKTGGNLCGRHGGMNLEMREAAGLRLEAGRYRIVELTSRAIDQIEDLMENAVSEPVRLKAATEVLDRAGIRGGTDLNVKVDVGSSDSMASLLEERLERLRNIGADIIDGEVVETDENPDSGGQPADSDDEEPPS